MRRCAKQAHSSWSRSLAADDRNVETVFVAGRPVNFSVLDEAARASGKQSEEQ